MDDRVQGPGVIALLADRLVRLLGFSREAVLAEIAAHDVGDVHRLLQRLGSIGGGARAHVGDAPGRDRDVHAALKEVGLAAAT